MAAITRDVTKDIFLTAFNCRTAGWFLRHEVGVPKPTPGDRLRMEDGSEIGQRARNTLPDGVFDCGSGIVDAAAKMRRLMAEREVQTLFEATFHVDGYTARAAILHRIERLRLPVPRPT